VPTVIAIAVYFCVADGVLIAQCAYYNWVNGRKGEGMGEGGRGTKDGAIGGVGGSVEHTNVDVIGEEEPLLSRQRSGSITIPGSQMRRRTMSSSGSSAGARRRSSQSHDVLARILEENDGQGGTRLWMRNLLSILGIMTVGTAGWAIAWGSGAWTPTPVGSGGASGGGGDTGPLGAQVLGYLSAAAYLGARIPQIVKNAREKSCEGALNISSPLLPFHTLLPLRPNTPPSSQLTQIPPNTQAYPSSSSSSPSWATSPTARESSSTPSTTTIYS
jgi:solute carrier family 66 (lysosomal lysine-arginine transporter), member 1